MFTDLSPTYKGILFALIGYTSFSWSDATVKFLTQHYDIYQIIATNALIGSIGLIALAPKLGGWVGFFDKSHLKIHGLRILFNVLICILFTYSLAHIPLTTVYALVFTKPFFASILAIFLYKQKLHSHQAIAIFLGFVGTMIVLQPGTTEFDLILLLPLAVTVVIALLFLVSNSLQGASVLSLGLFPVAGALILTLPLALNNFVLPETQHIWAFLLAGICSTSGIVFISLAFRTADAAVVSPYTYSEIIWAIAFSTLIFNETPGWATVIGATIIIGSGLYLINKERLLSRAKSRA